MKIFNEKKAQQFWSKKNITNIEEDPTRHGDKERLEFDVNHILKVVGKKNVNSLLDLGAGTGQLTKAIEKNIPIKKRILVEKNPSFIRQILLDGKVDLVNEDILEFCKRNNNKYDIILLFGVINSINKENTYKIYEYLLNMMKKDSILIIKHQCGIEEEVIIDNFSKELTTLYTARYPYHKDEHQFLEDIFNVEIHDIYPKKLNKFVNTHFFSYVCKKK